MPKERWEDLENYVAATLPGAVKTKGSGSVHRDGDTNTERFLVECKLKETVRGISVPAKEVLKARQQAVRKNRQPMIVMENALGEKWAIVNYDEMVRLLETIEKFNDVDYIDLP